MAAWTHLHRASNGKVYPIHYSKVNNDHDIHVHVDSHDPSEYSAGFAHFTRNSDKSYSAKEVEVGSKHRRKGIASAIYRHLEQRGHKIVSSDEANEKGIGHYAGQTDQGVAFYNNRHKASQHAEQVVQETINILTRK